MKILLISSAYNGLTQRAHVELAARGHEVHIALAIGDAQMIEAVALAWPDIVICPFLKSKLPEAIWRRTRSVVIHPGVVGDRGPSALDWAIHRGETRWGVTAFEANGDFDAGDVWASESFAMRSAPKASLYRQEVTDAAVRCILQTIDGVMAGKQPTPLRLLKDRIQGRPHPLMTQADRAIDWQHDSTLEIVRKIHAADSSPGVLSRLCGLEVYLYGVHEEAGHRGRPGEVVARRDGAVCIATTDAAVWISHLKLRRNGDRPGLKLPATRVLGPRLTLPEHAPSAWPCCSGRGSYHEISYHEACDVGYLQFDFHNGAMSTAQCLRLHHAFRWAMTRPTKAIVLLGGEDFFANGIHLGVIEAAPDPVAESWRNIHAINDLVLEVLSCTSHLTVSALQGNAGAGGLIFALACDQVAARSGRILNPHYQTMALHGSEYWTWLLPRRIGAEATRDLTESCLPIGAEQAVAMGLADLLIDARGAAFMARLANWLHELCRPRRFAALLRAKRKALPSATVLERHRLGELARMRSDFSSPAYAAARKAFVYKQAPAETPRHLAHPAQRIEVPRFGT